MSELDRTRRLAKALANIEKATVVIYRNDDGTFGFTPISNHVDKPIVEYISHYGRP